jgi:hypothetical protein
LSNGQHGSPSDVRQQCHSGDVSSPSALGLRAAVTEFVDSGTALASSAHIDVKNNLEKLTASIRRTLEWR